MPDDAVLQHVLDDRAYDRDRCDAHIGRCFIASLDNDDDDESSCHNDSDYDAFGFDDRCSVGRYVISHGTTKYRFTRYSVTIDSVTIYSIFTIAFYHVIAERHTVCYGIAINDTEAIG